MSKIRAAKNGTKKDVIIHKGASLFRKKGYAASTMRELAESLGVEASSLYNHIGAKREILQGICFSVANDFTNHLDLTENNPANSIEKLETIIRFHIHMMLDSFDMVYVANREWKQLEEPYLSEFLHQRKAYEMRLAEIVKTGICSGELKKINPHVAVLIILSAVRGLEFWQRHKKDVPVSELEHDMITHLLKGLIK